MKVLWRTAITFLASSALSGDIPTWWSQYTPKGDVIECTSAENQDNMISILKKAGWNTDRIPSIDWTRQYPVIVAPKKSFDGKELVPFDIEVTDLYYVHYGWRDIPPPPPPPPGAPGSITLESSGKGPQTLAIAVPRKVNPDSIACVYHEPER